MKKIIIFFYLLIASSVKAATTYVPIYQSFISIATATGEIVKSEERGSISLSVETEDFRISVVHEEMTKEKVRTIKRKKAAAGWMAASTILSSVSALSSGSAAGFEARTANARLSGLMTRMYADNAKAEQILKIQVQFSNLSQHEMMVADIERGLVWYVRSGSSFVMELRNPDVAQLRICKVDDTLHTPLYATVCGGSSIRKEDIVFENDELWIVSPTEEDYDFYQIPKEREYQVVYKEDFSHQAITYEEYKSIKKQR